jgi:hypothetical protein
MLVCSYPSAGAINGRSCHDQRKNVHVSPCSFAGGDLSCVVVVSATRFLHRALTPTHTPLAADLIPRQDHPAPPQTAPGLSAYSISSSSAAVRSSAVSSAIRGAAAILTWCNVSLSSAFGGAVPRYLRASGVTVCTS